MEVFLLLLIIFFAADSEWLGQHLSNIKQWYDYYNRQPNPKVRCAIAKRRAKNIRKIRNERYRKTKT